MGVHLIRVSCSLQHFDGSYTSPIQSLVLFDKFLIKDRGVIMFFLSFFSHLKLGFVAVNCSPLSCIEHIIQPICVVFVLNKIILQLLISMKMLVFADSLLFQPQFCKISVPQYESDLMSVVNSLILSMNDTDLHYVNSGACNASCIRFSLVKLLRRSGYDAAVCATKWQGSGKVPGGMLLNS